MKLMWSGFRFSMIFQCCMLSILFPLFSAQGPSGPQESAALKMSSKSIDRCPTEDRINQCKFPFEYKKQLYFQCVRRNGNESYPQCLTSDNKVRSITKVLIRNCHNMPDYRWLFTFNIFFGSVIDNLKQCSYLKCSYLKMGVMATRWLSPFSGVARACAHAHTIFTAVSKRDAVS